MGVEGVGSGPSTPSGITANDQLDDWTIALGGCLFRSKPRLVSIMIIMSMVLQVDRVGERLLGFRRNPKLAASSINKGKPATPPHSSGASSRTPPSPRSTGQLDVSPTRALPQVSAQQIEFTPRHPSYRTTIKQQST